MRQLDLTERMLHLRGVGTLRSVPSSDLAQLAATMRLRRFQKGQTLLAENEPPRSFFLVLSGTVGMWRHGHRIGTIHAPGSVGFMASLARGAGGTQAVAQSFVEAYEVAADAIDEIFEDHFTALLGTLRVVAERLVEENRQLEPPPYSPPAVPFGAVAVDRELDVVERIFVVRQARPLAPANVNSLAALARRMNELRCDADMVLWEPGDTADFTLFVVSGMLELRWNEGKTVQTVGPGYLLGGGEALVGLPRWNTLTTRDPVVLLRGARDDLVDLFEDDFELARTFLAMMATFLVARWDKKAEAGVFSLGDASVRDVSDAAAALPLAPGGDGPGEAGLL